MDNYLQKNLNQDMDQSNYLITKKLQFITDD